MATGNPALDLDHAVEAKERTKHLPRPIAVTVDGTPWRVWTNGFLAAAAPGVGGEEFEGRDALAKLVGEALRRPAIDRFPIRELAAFAECRVVEAVDTCKKCEGSGKRNRWCVDCENSHPQPCCACGATGSFKAPAKLAYRGRVFDARLIAPLANGIDAAGGEPEAVVGEFDDEPRTPLYVRAADGSWACAVMPMYPEAVGGVPVFLGGDR